MKLKSIIKHAMPTFIANKIRSMKNAARQNEFNALETAVCDTSTLRSIKDLSLDNVLKSSEADDYWDKFKNEVNQFNIPDGTEGVNPGDRRALYYFVSMLKPKSILEIGTHIGASTIHIASALHLSQVKNGEDVSFLTLDIRDVNSVKDKPWLEYKSKFSPLEMINKFEYGNFVKFITDKSIDYLKNSKEKFDFIFLDGCHLATTVYQEVPAALKLLNPNGLILLHDYFPNNKPLWSDGSIIQGPAVAVDRLVSEGADLKILPLGALPWPTKLNSNVTSLALLMKKS